MNREVYTPEFLEVLKTANPPKYAKLMKGRARQARDNRWGKKPILMGGYNTVQR